MNLDRSLTILADGVPVGASCRKRLSGKDGLSLYPSLFELRLWNLPDSDYLVLRHAREISVSHGESCLASGTISDVFRRGTKDGVLTTAAFSLGLNLWEAVVSLTVPAGTLLSETIRRILSASGTGIPLLSFPAEDLPLPRPLVCFGRAAEEIASALSMVSARAMLTPSGLMVVPPGGLPVSLVLTEKDLTDEPSFAGENLMILSAPVSGWRPGQTIRLEHSGIAAEGIISERSVDADTGGGPWACEMIVEFL